MQREVQGVRILDERRDAWLEENIRFARRR
jgi:hypothetical protein